MEELCISDELTYLSNPPQKKCKFCLQTWVIDGKIPLCKKGKWQMIIWSKDKYEIWKILGTTQEFKLPMDLLKEIRSN